jgi:hypothetical protein
MPDTGMTASAIMRSLMSHWPGTVITSDRGATGVTTRNTITTGIGSGAMTTAGIPVTATMPDMTDILTGVAANRLGGAILGILGATESRGGGIRSG